MIGSTIDKSCDDVALAIETVTQCAEVVRSLESVPPVTLRRLKSIYRSEIEKAGVDLGLSPIRVCKAAALEAAKMGRGSDWEIIIAVAVDIAHEVLAANARTN